jgi:hypothetical protein
MRRRQLIAHHAALQDNPASVIDPVKLEHILGNVDAEGLDLLSGPTANALALISLQRVLS